jgi:ankyrin repeat protein
MYTVANDNKEIVKNLLKSGAIQDIENHEGLTALKLAIKKGNHEMISMLRIYR